LYIETLLQAIPIAVCRRSQTAARQVAKPTVPARRAAATRSAASSPPAPLRQSWPWITG